MAFKIMARTILELGAELISSDDVALYELIKNAVDAGSSRVRIEVQVYVTRSQFDEILSLVDLDGSRSRVVDDLRRAFRKKGLVDIDEEIVADLFTRLESTRRRAPLDILHSWYDRWNWIDVIDRGHGMTIDELRDVYLTIGTRSRHSVRMRLDPGDPTANAPLGEKGVGRLSTMRLGDKLLVRTAVEDEPYESLLEVDWSLFSHASDAYLEDIDIVPRIGDRKEKERAHGTTITIQSLKGDWSAEKLAAIARTQFAKLVDPFGDSRADDLLRIRFNAQDIDVPDIDRRYLDLAHAHCEARFTVEDGRPELAGVVDYRLRGKRFPFRLTGSELMAVTRAPSVEMLEEVGAFDMEMWWYNRRLITAIDKLGTQKEIREEVNRWSGGLMLFRDGYRVNPYGAEGDDWLELDRKAFGSKGFKMNRQQIVGRVRISWRNRGLVDQTNREGLMDSPQKQAFIHLLQTVLFNEFKPFIDNEDKAVRVAERTTFENIEEKVETTEGEVRLRLRQIRNLLPRENRHLVDQALKLIAEITGYLGEAKALSDEVAGDRAQLVHLAGVGLMVEFIMHELDRTTSATLDTLAAIDRNSLDRPAASAVSVLSDQLRTIGKRVGNLDPLSGARRQTKESFDVGAAVREIVSGHEGKLDRHGITIVGNYRDLRGWKIKAVRGMFIQIIENLLSNSFFWLIQECQIDPNLAPVITIDLDPEGATVAVTDNGPGVDPEMATAIFQPFVTRRPAGKGHGLGLYISREVANYHGWTLDIERSQAVHAGRLNTFILDMDGA
jgi:signal transduction histidine kinase